MHTPTHTAPSLKHAPVDAALTRCLHIGWKEMVPEDFSSKARQINR